MNPAINPINLFRFAIRDRDWPLAAALARALHRSESGRLRLEAELARSTGPRSSRQPSLGALRSLALVLKALGLGRDRG